MEVLLIMRFCLDNRVFIYRSHIHVYFWILEIKTYFMKKTLLSVEKDFFQAF